MILKVDHISYSCGMNVDFFAIIPKGYQLAFKEENLINVEAKKSFLKNKNYYHNIYMFENDENMIPIEVTQYTEIENCKSNLDFQGDVLIYNVLKVKDSTDFFSILGEIPTAVKDGFTILELKFALDKRKILLYFKEASEIYNEPYLDVVGYSSLGIWVDSVEKYHKKYIENGYFPSDISEITVNKKQLKIFFVKGKNCEILEIIGLKR